MTFVDSHDVPGVQLADICANICYKYYSSNRKYRPYRLLRSQILGQDGTEIHIGLFNESSLRTDAAENHVHPYSEEDLAEDVRLPQRQ
jgi:hypothetical protein